MTTDAVRISGFGELKRDAICYWQTSDGVWMLWLPDCGLGDLRNHDVTEHDDGTITVSPSILVTGETQRHGFIERGVWRDA